MADSTAIFEEHTSWSSDRLTGESDQLFMWAEPRSAQAIGNVKVIVPVEGKIQPLELFGHKRKQLCFIYPLLRRYG
jgi:hypothetical protein